MSIVSKIRDRITALGGIQVGVNNEHIKGINYLTASVNPASIAAATKLGTVVTMTGVAAGDIVIATPPAALEDDLVPAGCVAGTDQVTLYIYNPTAGAIDGAALTWEFLHIDLT